MQEAGIYNYALHLIQDEEEGSRTTEPKYLYLKEMSHLDRQKKKKELFALLGQTEVQLLPLLGAKTESLSELACFARAQGALRNRENLKKSA